jgi:uncharacterized lipoprotein YajG
MNSLIRKLFVISLAILLAACANDVQNSPPRLDLSPNVLISESNIGQGFIIQLTVKNQIDSKATSAYGIENNLQNLFQELITDALERQEFEVVTAKYRDPKEKVTELEVTIKTLSNQINESNQAFNIIANAVISVSAKNDDTVLSLDFSSTRTKEVPLNPTIDEVTELTELAIAQVIKRFTIDEKILELATRKP